MTVLPMRGGAEGLALCFDLDELLDAHTVLNPALEQAWASALLVLAEGWPDVPVEVWARVDEGADGDGLERVELGYRVFFAGEGRGSEVADSMSAFLRRALSQVLGVEPELSWLGVEPNHWPIWAIDDGAVYRLLAADRTIEESVLLVGEYGGEPTLFSAALEAWPLHDLDLGIQLAEADTDWAF